MNDHVKDQLCARIEELEKEKLELNEQVDSLQKERDDLKAEHEKLVSYTQNGIECFASPCPEHSGVNTPPFSEFWERYGRLCLICVVDERDALAGPAVQGEPVAWRYRMLSEDWEKIATIHPSTFHPDHKDLIIEPLYTAPQPAEQQPDVAQLVDALEYLMGNYPASRHVQDTCTAALAAYRKGGDV